MFVKSTWSVNSATFTENPGANVTLSLGDSIILSQCTHNIHTFFYHFIVNIHGNNAPSKWQIVLNNKMFC